MINDGAPYTGNSGMPSVEGNKPGWSCQVGRIDHPEFFFIVFYGLGDAFAQNAKLIN